MQKSGWYEAEGDSFYLNDYGAGVVKCWRLGTDGKYRYLKADGRMAVKEWIVDYGKTLLSWRGWQEIYRNPCH